MLVTQCSEVVWRVLATHSIRQFPLHFPYRASPCAIRFQLSCNAGYTMFRGSVKGTGYPLHSSVSPSLPLPCFTVCHHISTASLQRITSTELKSDTSVMLIRHLHLVLSLRTSVVIPPFLPNVFMTLCLIKQREFFTLLRPYTGELCRLRLAGQVIWYRNCAWLCGMDSSGLVL